MDYTAGDAQAICSRHEEWQQSLEKVSPDSGASTSDFTFNSDEATRIADYNCFWLRKV